MDRDEDFIDSARASAHASDLRMIVAKSRKEAQGAIAAAPAPLVSILINRTLVRPHELSILRYARMSRPAASVSILLESAEEDPFFGIASPQEIGLNRVLRKPFEFSSVLQSLILPDGADGRTDEGESTPENAIEASDDDFVPVLTEDFAAGARCFFDLYFRNAKGHYSRLARGGSVFSMNRVGVYLTAGVKFFYIRKEEQSAYSAKLDRVIAGGFSAAGALESRVIDFLVQQGVPSPELDAAKQLLEETEKGVLGGLLGGIPLVRSFLSTPALVSHARSTVLLGALVLRAMRMDSLKIHHTLSLACLLHDVGVMDFSLDLRTMEEDRLGADQFSQYRLHPLRSAEILRSIRGLDPLVLQIIEGHHERRDRKGYPRRLGAGGLNPLSEVVGMCDDLVGLIAKAMQNPRIDPRADFFERFAKRYSTTVVNAFRIAVFPSDSNS